MGDKKEDKQDSGLRTTTDGELVGHDMLQARAWALEHAQRELPARHRWLRDVPPEIPLLWEVASSRSIEEQDCYEVVVACYPDEGEVKAKARWTYHIDFRGRPAPGTPVLEARLEWTAPVQEKAAPVRQPAPPAAPAPTASDFRESGQSKLDAADYQGAIADYTRAIELDPKDAFAYRVRGEAYKALGKKKEAEADFARAKELVKSR